MKKIKTINKLLSSLTLLSPLSGICFNNKYENQQTVVTENSNSLNNYFSTNAAPVQMGDIWVTVDDSDPTIITGYSSGNGTLIVASNIKQIKDNAFNPTLFGGTPELQGLDLSQATSLTTIGERAFESCSNLTGNIVIPSSVTTINSRAFYETDITSLDLSQAISLTIIDIYAFHRCSNLTGDLVIPSTVTNIAPYAFSHTNIISLDLSQATSLTKIGKKAFENCSNILGDLVIPSNVTSIEEFAFSYTNIISLDLSQATSLTTIGDNAFYYCENLTGDLFIPQNLTSISKKAFWNASEFTSINIDPLNKNFSLATNLGSKAKVLISGTNDGIWNNNSIALIAWEDITIPSNVTSIEESAFSFTNITSLDLSQATNLTTIGNKSFEYCKNITSLNLSQAASLTTIGNNAFESCSNLTGNIVIPSSVTSIGVGAFSSTKIISLDLFQATSLKNIGDNTFQDCESLTNIVIPSSVVSIGDYAFGYYGSFQQNKTLDLSQATSLTTIGDNAFYSCLKSSGSIIIPSSVTTIGQSAFANNTINNLYFLSETPPASFGANWQPTVTGKVYVPSEEAKSKYTSAQNFGFTEEQIEVIGVSGKALINIDEKSKGSEQYTTIGGFSATKWEIVMTEGEQPEWLSIDNQGILSWTDQCVVGTYKFKIKATNDLQASVESAPITFVVNEPIEPEPSKSNTGLILGLLLGLGIPIVLAIGFGIWYLTKKKKTTVKI